MNINNKIFPILLPIFIIYFLCIVIAGQNLRKNMLINKDEVFKMIEQEFGKPQEVYDTSKDSGYAFLYFDLGKINSYELRLKKIGFTQQRDIFCYKDASVSRVKDRYRFIINYVYPDVNCEK